MRRIELFRAFVKDNLVCKQGLVNSGIENNQCPEDCEYASANTLTHSCFAGCLYCGDEDFGEYIETVQGLVCNNCGHDGKDDDITW